MNAPRHLVVFALEDHRYALWLGAVERVVRMVEITPLPGAPPIVLGAVNVQGSVVPVVSVRERFQLPERAPALDDQLVIARTSKRRVALVADAVSGVLECPAEQWVAAEKIVPGLEFVAGIARLSDGLIVVHDLERFISLEEECALTEALSVETRHDS